MHLFDAVDSSRYREHHFTVVFACNGASNFHLAVLDAKIDQSVGNPSLGVESSADRSTDLRIRGRFVRIRSRQQDVGQYAMKCPQHRQINIIHTQYPSYRPRDIRIQPYIRHFATPLPQFLGAPHRGRAKRRSQSS